MAGVRYAISKIEFPIFVENSQSIGYTLGYQFGLRKDEERLVQPYLSYLAHYNPQILLQTRSSQYAVMEHFLMAGIKRRWSSGYYTYGGIGPGLTNYIYLARKGELNPTHFSYALQMGIGYGFRR